LKIEKLTLINFRNYEKKDYRFEDGINLIIGRNGAGKTNILEAIYFLSTTTSHRTVNNANLISYGKPTFKIKSSIVDEHGRKNIDAEYSRDKGLHASVNMNRIKNRELIEKFPVIMFSPEDIALLTGEPGGIRRLFNIFMSQVNPVFIEKIIKFSKSLKERNSLLKEQYPDKEKQNRILDIWTGVMKRYSDAISRERELFVRNLNTIIEKETVQMKLKYSMRIEYIKTAFKGKTSLNDDIRYGFSTWGAHRDRFVFRLNKKDIRSYASRGEIRIAALLFKLGLWQIIRKKKGHEPVILLDDVFSEIDKKNRELIIDKLHGIQSLITATEIPVEFSREVNIIRI